MKFRSIITSLSAVILLCGALYSLPASSFIIIPSGIDNSVYTGSQTLYKVESSDEDFTLSDTASQKIVSIKSSGDKTTVLINAGETVLKESSDLNIYLKNTQYLNTDKESIKKTAAKFKNSNDQVRDVSIFVYNHISDKKMGMPLISAVSILTGKAGDCKEHSILTISILRTLQIPARAVMGMILTDEFSGEKHVFVYHMWAEAYYKGKWVLVDSTRPMDTHPNRYIALAYHNLMTEAPSEYLRAISTMQDMKITRVR